MSSTRSYSLVEPHPRTTAPYIHGARGGAGNVFKTASSPWSKPSSTTSTSSSSSSSSPRTLSSEHKQPSTFKSGRGGAGNTHHSSERAMFSFDEELEREMRQQAAMAPVYHVGRGGAGNMIYPDSSSTMRRRDPETASARSSSSAESAADGATKAVRRSLEKGWAKVVGAGSSS